jgi:hypothetical protein
MNRMLKEKKKLTTKVEILTRKVQNLQNKLAADKGPAPAPSSTSNSLPLSKRDPQMPSRDHGTPVSHPGSSRVISGPASLLRSKTPERRPSQPVVFKARTPEKRVTPPIPVTVGMQESTSMSSVGKKRARPEEFDAVSIPVQATILEQERENATPRLRRALHNVQAHTGFTPARQTKVRTSLGAPSPGRRATTGIVDMTNSPRSMASQTTKASKRSWLGKIRGVSSNSQTSSSRTPSLRPGVCERVPGS